MKRFPLAIFLGLLIGAAGATAYWYARSDRELPPASSPHWATTAGCVNAVSRSDVYLERMIGQMIVVGFIGRGADDSGVMAVREQLAKGIIGGVILFERNVRSPRQVVALNAAIRRAGGDTVPLIAIDQEGGAVQRLTPRSGHGAFPSPAEVAGSIGPDPAGLALSLYGDMAGELKAAGFNANFGPTVDLNTNPDSPIIGRLGRSFGADPHEVLRYASIFNLAHQRADILTAAKHFPGHGSSHTDSHVALADISTTWKPLELEPFASLADDVDMVMVGHLYHPRFSDGPGIPASLSKRAVSALRNDIGFTGVIVSDDMEMAAVREHFSLDDVIVRAVAAGTDLLVFANRIAPRDDLGRHIQSAILCAVRTGTIPRSRIEQAYGRILLMKGTLARLSLFLPPLCGEGPRVGVAPVVPSPDPHPNPSPQGGGEIEWRELTQSITLAAGFNTSG